MNTSCRNILAHAGSAGLAALWAGVMWSVPLSLAAKEQEATVSAEYFQTLRDFQSIEQETARKPVATLDAQFRKDLEKLEKDMRSVGNLESAAAAEDALKNLDEGRWEVASADARVAALQKTYLPQRKAADIECQKALLKLDEDFSVKFTKLAEELAQSGQAAKAEEVRTHVDSIKARIKAGGEGAITKANELAVWKKKALDDFPTLADPKSALSVKVKARVKELTASNPSYFSDPQWPYLLAKEAGEFATEASPTTESEVVEKQIPRGAKRFRGRKFFVFDETVSWTTAQKKCHDLGGRLAVIPDEDTNIAVREITQGKNVWLGCSEPNNDGKWVWVDGSPMKYRKFGGKEPDNLGGHEQYLVMDAGGNWSDYNEKSNLVVGYVCEWTNRPADK